MHTWEKAYNGSEMVVISVIISSHSSSLTSHLLGLWWTKSLILKGWEMFKEKVAL